MDIHLKYDEPCTLIKIKDDLNSQYKGETCEKDKAIVCQFYECDVFIP